MADELCILDVCLLYQSKNIQNAVNNRGKWRSKNRAAVDLTLAFPTHGRIYQTLRDSNAIKIPPKKAKLRYSSSASQPTRQPDEDFFNLYTTIFSGNTFITNLKTFGIFNVCPE